MKKTMDTKTVVLGAILTALVVVLQFMGAFIRFGPFSISLVLIPIVLGASLGGMALGAWLGLVFGVVVLLSGDAAAFLAVNAAGTILTVLLKGFLCGIAAGGVYRLLSKKNVWIAVLAAAFVCPVVNTGVFLLGCLAFFMDTLAIWAEGLGFSSNITEYMIFVLVGWNFLFELGSNIVLSPTLVRLLSLRKKA